MNKKCAKCSKTVYPTEELKCLDKVWHKFCFKCEACGMTLNMKNYKGYDKLPYCNAHYPTSKHTAVADTPESRRIAENTKIQSNIQYHADFERQKGTKTSVVDDPETARIKQNTAIQSNVNYWGVREQREQMETRRPTEMVDDVTRRGRNPGKISEYNPPAVEEEFASPYSQRTSANVVYDSQRGEVHSQRVQPGSIADYDPMNEKHSSVVRNSYGAPQDRGYNPLPAQAPPQPQPQPARVSQPPPPKQPAYQAIYDYTAADSDEVSFNEGDIIVNTQTVDAGWMTGTVQRTGQHGMLPSNYVERVN